MQEVDLLAVDLGRELRVRVEPSPPGRASRTRAPVLGELLAARPAGCRGSSRRRAARRASGPSPSRSCRSSSSAWGISMRKGRISSLMAFLLVCGRGAVPTPETVGTIAERYVPGIANRIDACERPRPGCCGCCPCCRPGGTGPAPSWRIGSASPPARSATTWSGCASWATPSRPDRGWPAVIGWAPAAPPAAPPRRRRGGRGGGGAAHRRERLDRRHRGDVGPGAGQAAADPAGAAAAPGRHPPVLDAAGVVARPAGGSRRPHRDRLRLPGP